MRTYNKRPALKEAIAYTAVIFTTKSIVRFNRAIEKKFFSGSIEEAWLKVVFSTLCSLGDSNF